MGSNTTMVLTSCDRHDLLKETLDSFIRVNCGGGKPDATIIIEDSTVPMPDWLRENIHYYSANIGKVSWIQNGARMGQVYSIDRAYQHVKTDFIFHCEDDWRFDLGGGWMQESKAILEQNPKIIQVSLRGPTGWHQLIDLPPYEGFKVAMPGWKGGWGGLSWNPGLRRLSDYRLIGSYGKHISYENFGLESERILSQLYLGMGYRMADLNRPIVSHTGGSCSRSANFKAPMPKILIAIPVCHKFNYGQWRSGDDERFDQANAFENRPYGMGIHIDGPNPRVQALRETWLQDVAPFSKHVDYRLFYGRAECPHGEGNRQADIFHYTGACMKRDSLPDEVFLDVPDDYGSLPQKTIAMCQYAKERDYDFLFKPDDDTYVRVDKLVAELLGNRFMDYGGFCHAHVAGGGPGYWLSRRAFSIVAEKANLENWAEDVTVSKTLHYNGIQPVNLPGHRSGMSNHWFDVENMTPDLVAVHAVQPEAMRELYRRDHAEIQTCAAD